MKILAKLTFAALVSVTAAQAAQAEKVVIATGGSYQGGSIVGYTPNPFPPYPAPRPIPLPWPGPVCLSCPPLQIAPGLDREIVRPGGVLIMR